MQLVSLFIGLVQAYCPYDPQIEAQIPACCPVCGFPRPEGKGTYCRSVWLPAVKHIEVRRVRCRRTGCGVTISLLPSFCVPFKRYSSGIVESCLDSVVRRGHGIGEWCEREGLTDRSTAGSWVRQFSGRCGVLSTEGAVRLGVRQPGGRQRHVRQLWGALRQWAGREPVLRAVQPALCLCDPFLGLFRARL
jgi:hypothetical protein